MSWEMNMQSETHSSQLGVSQAPLPAAGSFNQHQPLTTTVKNGQPQGHEVAVFLFDAEYTVKSILGSNMIFKACTWPLFHYQGNSKL